MRSCTRLCKQLLHLCVSEPSTHLQQTHRANPSSQQSLKKRSLLDGFHALQPSHITGPCHFSVRGQHGSDDLWRIPGSRRSSGSTGRMLLLRGCAKEPLGSKSPVSPSSGRAEGNRMLWQPSTQPAITSTSTASTKTVTSGESIDKCLPAPHGSPKMSRTWTGLVTSPPTNTQAMSKALSFTLFLTAPAGCAICTCMPGTNCMPAPLYTLSFMRCLYNHGRLSRKHARTPANGGRLQVSTLGNGKTPTWGTKERNSAAAAPGR